MEIFRRSLCFFLAVVSVSVFAETAPKALFLTWQQHPESTITVCWVTPDRQESDAIAYCCQENGRWSVQSATTRKLPGNNPYFIHTGEITHLNPNSSYRFHIGQYEKTYRFHTLPATLQQPIKFVAGGDMYHDDLKTLHMTNQQAARTAPDFALVGGDIAYASGLSRGFGSFFNKLTGKSLSNPAPQEFDRWLEWLQAWSEDMVTPQGDLIPLLPVLGNHDTMGDFDQQPANAPFFYALFPMPGPQGYNVLDFGNYMTLVLLDSGHTHPICGQQTEWLDQTLRAREARPTKFALYHVPAYPSYRAYTYPFSTQVRQCWTPLFDRYHLTMAFENHDHDYKRTRPLRGGVVDPQGVLYVGDGAWGVKNPRQPRKDKNHWYVAKSAPARHFLLVEIGPEGRTLTAISSDGVVFDTLKF